MFCEYNRQSKRDGFAILVRNLFENIYENEMTRLGPDRIEQIENQLKPDNTTYQKIMSDMEIL